jgi:hypothetical protein
MSERERERENRERERKERERARYRQGSRSGKASSFWTRDKTLIDHFKLQVLRHASRNKYQ